MGRYRLRVRRTGAAMGNFNTLAEAVAVSKQFAKDSGIKTDVLISPLQRKRNTGFSLW